jgi:hypothetical protein
MSTAWHRQQPFGKHSSHARCVTGELLLSQWVTLITYADRGEIIRCSAGLEEMSREELIALSRAPPAENAWLTEPLVT